MGRHRPDVSTQEIVALYERGFSCMEVGQIVGITDAAIWHRLKKAGVIMRPNHRGSINIAQKMAKQREMIRIMEAREAR